MIVFNNILLSQYQFILRLIVIREILILIFLICTGIYLSVYEQYTHILETEDSAAAIGSVQE